VGAVLGALAGLIALLVVGGLDLEWLFAGASERFIDTQPGSAFPRVRLPGGPLAYGLLWYAASRTLATGGWSRLGWTLAVAWSRLGSAETVIGGIGNGSGMAGWATPRSRGPRAEA